ncbi:MAG: TetR/AcrR family transcriptional regulator [Ilumatobacteraceae bacterium]
MQPDQRRAAILDAAVAEIADRGFARTTSRQVAARAGVTHGLLHHYFPDHDSLLAAAFEKVATEEMDEVREALASDRDPLAQLRELTEPYGPGGGEDAYRFWLEAWSEAAHSPTLRDTSDRLSRAWHDLVVGVIERGNASGMFHCENPTEVAWMVVALSDAYALHSQSGSALELEQMARVTQRLTERELGLEPGTLAQRT